MILREATIKYKGYDPNSLSKGSKKRICIVCNECGRVRYLIFKEYNKLKYPNLCKSCIRGKLSPNWKGGEITLICHQCRKEFRIKSALKNRSKFCSQKCQGLWRSENLIGKNHWLWKPKITLTCKYCGKEFKVKLSQKNRAKFCSKKCMSKSYSKNRIGKNGTNWKGGFDWSRPYVLPIYNCNCLNNRFLGSEGHHINRDTVIFIPKELHKHIYHSLKNNINMIEINMLAIQFINGGL